MLKPKTEDDESEDQSMGKESKSTSNRKRWEASDIVKRDREVNEALVIQNTDRVMTRNQTKLIAKNL